MKGNGHGVGTFINLTIPSLPLTKVYDARNVRGWRYLTGRLGTKKVLIVETDKVSDGDRGWQMYLAEGPHPLEGAAAFVREVEGARCAELAPGPWLLCTCLVRMGERLEPTTRYAGTASSTLTVESV